MAKSLSMDLRTRVLAAVEGGMSCRSAAARFGVSVSSAIRWNARQRSRGDARPQRQGGDRRSARIEAHGPTILRLERFPISLHRILRRRSSCWLRSG